MAEKEKQIIDTISKALPIMTDSEKEKLLAFSEGMACMAMIGKQVDRSAGTVSGT